MCHDVRCRDILEKAEGKINWRGPARQIAGQAHPLVQQAHGQFLARANAAHPERQVDFRQGRHARSLQDGPTRVVHNGHHPFAAIDKVVSRVLQQHGIVRNDIQPSLIQLIVDSGDRGIDAPPLR
jgi:hypothetical protein